MSQHRLWNKIILGIGCFILSAVISLPFFSAWRDALAISHPEPTATHSFGPAILATAYAMVWVDDLARPEPVVEAVWIAWVPTDFSAVELDYLSLNSNNRRYIPEQSGVSVDSLPDQVRNAFGGSIALDHADLAALADLVGGIPIGNQTLGASDLTDYLTVKPADTPDQVMIRQAAVMQGLIAQLTLTGRKLSVRDILAIPQHKTIDDAVLNAIVYQYYPLQIESVRVRPNSRANP